MPSRLPAGLLVLVLIYSPHLMGAASGVTQTIGEAFDMQSNELLYRETHCLKSNNTARQVTYQTEEGQVIARKLIDYKSGMTTPSFVQQNLVTNETIKVELSGEEVTMSVLDTNQVPRNITRKRVSEKIPMVIDAGFDYFVQENWNQLVAGKTQIFQFPLASRAKLVELRLNPTTCSYDSETDQCFKLDVNSWLLRILVAPIELGYDTDLKRLKRYRGLSNIEDKKGKGMVVDIRYRYQDLPGTSCQMGEQFMGRPEFVLTKTNFSEKQL